MIRDPNKIDEDKPFHLEVRLSLCGAHLQLAGSKVMGKQTAQSDIFFNDYLCKRLLLLLLSMSRALS